MRKMKRKKMSAAQPTNPVEASLGKLVSVKDLWDAICDTPEEAAGMRKKTTVFFSLNEHIKAIGLKRTAARYRVPEEKIRFLVRARSSQFSIEELEKMAIELGFRLPVQA